VISDLCTRRAGPVAAWKPALLLVLLFCLLAAAAAAAPKGTTGTAPKWEPIVVLYNSDVGGKIEPCG
jgi:hypothetical protein